ncbi:MAG: hypothetical protein H0T48_08165 [Gemmatimonadaceae bacterium]|nr:hypothetical protein [Gemmatimonadaceae bacterium]
MDEATTVVDSADAPRPHRTDPSMPVRSADLEPYTGLGYLSRLFKLMAAVLLLLLISEIITGLITQGRAAIPTLLGEVSRLVVLAGLLYGSGDLALLLIDIGHDIRATRILLGRQALHEEHQPKRDPSTYVERAPR